LRLPSFPPSFLCVSIFFFVCLFVCLFHAPPQVRLLLSLDQAEGALQRASSSKDPDLIFLVLLHFLQRPDNGFPGDGVTAELRRRREETFYVVANYPDAAALLVQYLRFLGDDRLMKYFDFTKDFMAMADVSVSNALADADAILREAQAEVQ